MSSKRVVDAIETTDKDYTNWKMRFKAAAGAFEQGRFKEARDLMFRALNQAESLDEKSFAVPASYLAIAVLNMEQKKMDEAKSFFDKGLREASMRPDDAGRELYAAGLRYLAMWHERNGSLDEAENRLRESVRTLEGLPTSETQLAFSMSDLGFILVQNGNIAEAQKVITKAMKLLVKTVGKDNPQYDFAKIIFEVCLNKNDEKTLMEAFELSATKLQYKMGARYPNLVRALNVYAEALKKRGLTEQLSEAKENFSALMRVSTTN